MTKRKFTKKTTARLDYKSAGATRKPKPEAPVQPKATIDLVPKVDWSGR